MSAQEPEGTDGRPAGERARIDMAKQDLRDAEKVDPDQASHGELAEAFQRVRNSLGDVLHIIEK